MPISQDFRAKRNLFGRSRKRKRFGPRIARGEVGDQWIEAPILFVGGTDRGPSDTTPAVCSSIILSERFLLTAAHCLTAQHHFNERYVRGFFSMIYFG